MSPGNRAPVDEPLGFLLSRAFRRWRWRLDTRLRDEGITYGTWVTLVYLQRGGNGMQQRSLAAFMGIEAPTLVRSLDRLERDGLIARRMTPGDRRARTVHLTAASSKVLDAFNEIAEAMRHHLTRGIDGRDLDTCRRVLRQIISNADMPVADMPADMTDGEFAKKPRRRKS